MKKKERPDSTPLDNLWDLLTMAYASSPLASSPSKYSYAEFNRLYWEKGESAARAYMDAASAEIAEAIKKEEEGKRMKK